MYEYGIYNIHTNEETMIYGYTSADAFRRAKLDKADWRISYYEYVD